MKVCCFSTLDELAPYANDWDRLSAGVPFRSWAWLSAWWRHYGQAADDEHPAARLFVTAVFDHDDTLVGLAPWYLDCSGAWCRLLRPLGSGEVCSDYLTVLCQVGMEDQLTQALAERLTEWAHAENRDPQRWDLLELTGCDAHDPLIERLAQHLAKQGNTIHRHPGPNCWRIELPTNWDDYLATLSKNHRKKLRRLQRQMVETGRAVLHSVERLDELPAAIEILIDLHGRRRRSLGEPGCFASARFAAFHREVMPELLRNGQLQLHWLELDGQPAAAEYQLAGDGVVYAYQAGVDPDALQKQPGRLMIMLTLRRAIEAGYRTFDFLRGDEPYKAQFRAAPRGAFTLRAAPDRPRAQLQHKLWLARNNLKQWIREGGRGKAEGEIKGEKRISPFLLPPSPFGNDSF